jgi:hypothetical protein
MGERQRHRRNRPLHVESLESVTLLSGLSAHLTHASHPPAIVSALRAVSTPVAINGTTRGFYTSDSPIPDTGTAYHLVSVGSLRGVGFAVVSGDLHSVGFIAQGHATGTLNVLAARGSLNLTLTGPSQPGFSPLPTEFSYTISSGTGRFHNASGSGTVDITLKPLTHHSPLSGAGRVTLTFHSTPTPTV